MRPGERRAAAGGGGGSGDGGGDQGVAGDPWFLSKWGQLLEVMILYWEGYQPRNWASPFPVLGLSLPFNPTCTVAGKFMGGTKINYIRGKGRGVLVPVHQSPIKEGLPGEQQQEKGKGGGNKRLEEGTVRHPNISLSLPPFFT
ncbi:hypothetical protein MLD38_029613 [Melastoma candidum]|uniref:Uncharacterized protein n=1 Tax=Melastoma candidum TaxID=119954 RepID=A0ACB9N490_9MYRT|nr:hypothetical protein MLD38_029613 [Melastoma candidum]